jgi:hypothetical protein
LAAGLVLIGAAAASEEMPAREDKGTLFERLGSEDARTRQAASEALLKVEVTSEDVSSLEAALRAGLARPATSLERAWTVDNLLTLLCRLGRGAKPAIPVLLEVLTLGASDSWMVKALDAALRLARRKQGDRPNE